MLLSFVHGLELLWLQVFSDSKKGIACILWERRILALFTILSLLWSQCQSPLEPWLRVVTPGRCQLVLMRLETAPRAMVFPSAPEFSDLWKFHLVSFISPSPSPPNKMIKSWPSLAFLCS